MSETAKFCPRCGAPLPQTVTVGAPSTGLIPDAPDRTQPAVPWRAREAIAVFLIHILITAIMVVPIALLVSGDDMLTAAGIMISELVLLVTLAAWIKIRYGLGFRALGFRGLSGANVAIGLGAGVGGLLVAGIVSQIIAQIVESITGSPPGDPEQIPLETDAPQGALLVIIAVSVIVLAPLAEEAFFRGFVYPSLRRWARAWPAILLSAAIFSITHVIPIVLLPIFALGMVLAWLVERRRSLVPAVVAHMAFNGFGFWVLYIASR